MKVTIETVVRPAGAASSYNIDAQDGDVLHIIEDGSSRVTIRYTPDEMTQLACMSIYVAQHERISAPQKRTLSSLIVPGGRG